MGLKRISNQANHWGFSADLALPSEEVRCWDSSHVSLPLLTEMH